MILKNGVSDSRTGFKVTTMAFFYLIHHALGGAVSFCIPRACDDVNHSGKHFAQHLCQLAAELSAAVRPS